MTHGEAGPLPRVRRPCAECPWRRDQPTGRFPAERFESLRETVEGPDGSAPIGAPLFACHRTSPDAPSACAGWLAVEGAGHVGVRLAVVGNRLDPTALTPAPGWPDLYESFDEMSRANGDGRLL